MEQKWNFEISHRMGIPKHFEKFKMKCHFDFFKIKFPKFSGKLSLELLASQHCHLASGNLESWKPGLLRNKAPGRLVRRGWAGEWQGTRQGSNRKLPVSCQNSIKITMFPWSVLNSDEQAFPMEKKVFQEISEQLYNLNMSKLIHANNTLICLCESRLVYARFYSHLHVTCTKVHIHFIWPVLKVGSVRTQ